MATGLDLWLSYVDNTASQQDLLDLATIMCNQDGTTAYPGALEKKALDLIDHLQENIFVLIKDQETPVGYCYLEKMQQSRREMFALFVAPSMRKQKVATHTLQKIKNTLGIEQEIYFTIYKQDAYTDIALEIDTERLISLAKKSGWSVQPGNYFLRLMGKQDSMQCIATTKSK